MNNNTSSHFKQSIFWLYYAKGLLQTKLGQHTEAVQSFTACIDYTNYAKVLTKANIYKDQKEYIKTIAQYDQAIRIDDNNAELYFGRATALFEVGKANQAKDDFAKYKSLNSLQTTEIN